jgi:hypothetical protein
MGSNSLSAETRFLARSSPLGSVRDQGSRFYNDLSSIAANDVLSAAVDQGVSIELEKE